MSLRIGKLFFNGGFFDFDCATFGGSGGFGFGQGTDGRRDAPLKFFAGHHALKQTIFGARHFGFGVLDLVLEGLEGFVGFDLKTLVPVFPRAFSPLLDVQLVFLAVFMAADQGVLGRGQFAARSFQARIGLGKAARECGQLLAQFIQA
ncbi:MAG: hypothetical protein ABSA32_01205 [Candidatus Acidiferrales bacterium]